MGSPLLLVPSYYSCVRLCSFVFPAVARAVDALALRGVHIGEHYSILSISMNHLDTPKTAKRKGEEIRGSLKQVKIGAPEWSFLSPKTKSGIQGFLAELGYYYRWDPSGSLDISHTAALILLSPQAKLTRYLYGLDFPVRDMQLALIEASEGKTRSIKDRILLYCFRYDPLAGKYTLFAWNFMKWGAVATLAGLALFYVFLKRRKKK